MNNHPNCTKISLRCNSTKNWIVSVLCILLVGNTPYMFAQNLPTQTRNNWYFGTTTNALIFDKTNLPNVEVNVVPNKAISFGSGGSAVISNPATGDLLFYTEGVRVYDATHTLVTGANNIGGNSTLKNPAIAVPVPSQQGQYFVFTNTGNSGSNQILYSILNSNLQGNATGAGQPPLGEITTTRATTGLANPGDVMIALKGTSNNYWLISQDRNDKSLKVLNINSATPTAIQSFNVYANAANTFDISAFAYNDARGILAIAPKNTSRNIVLLNFDEQTGQLSFGSEVTDSGNNDSFGNAIADLAWSSSGAELFISRLGGNGAPTGMVYQYGLDTLSQLNPVLISPIHRSFGIELGPDNKIYHIYQSNASSPLLIGRIDTPDSIFSATTYIDLPIGTARFGGQYFPSFIPATDPPFTNFDFTIVNSNTCVNNQVFFIPDITPIPERISWDFGNGTTAIAYSPIYTYEEAFSGQVTMTAVINGVERSISKTITVNANDAIPDFGADTTICKGEVFILDPFKNAQTQAPAGTTYSWSTGETTATITANSDTTRTYWVAMQYPNGCSGFDEIKVTVYGDESEVFNFWYFGKNAGINFTPTAAPVGDGAMVAPEGVATFSNLEGKMVFYTNGTSIWNKNHQIMINGTNLGGDSTVTQAVSIAPVSGLTPANEESATVFYIFMPSKVWGNYGYEMKYAIVDLKKNGGLGEVIVKNQTLFVNSTERITSAFGMANAYTIAHEYGNNTFRSYGVNGNGIGIPTISSEGTPHSFQDQRNAKGYMKLAPNGQLVAVAIPGQQNLLEIFQFDSIGALSNVISINIKETAPSQIYGVDFSPSSRKIYITTQGSGSKLIQYSLDSLQSNNPKFDIEATKNIVYTGSEVLGAIQFGPDGQQYVAINGGSALGIINGSNSDSPSFNPTGFPLARGTNSTLGLPNFVQNVSNQASTPAISFQNTCFGTPVSLGATGTSTIDQYDWIFGDRAGSSFPSNPDTVDVQNVERLYSAIGSYQVQLRVYNRCGFDTTFVRPIEIAPVPENPTIQSPQNICNQPFVELAAIDQDVSGYRYNWSNGDSTRVIRIDQASTLSVSIITGTNCESDVVEVLVLDQRPEIELGPDLTVCQNIALPDLDANLTGVSFTWKINNVVASNSRTQRVATNESGEFNYNLRVFDPILKCAVTDSVLVTVQDQPEVTDIQSFGSSCQTSNGKISFELKGTTNTVYSLSGPKSVAQTTFSGINPVTIDSLRAGIYTLAVSDLISGCSFTENVTIEDLASFDLLLSNQGACGIGLFVNGTVADSVSLTILDELGLPIRDQEGVLYDGKNVFLSSLFKTSPYIIGVASGGDYSVAMTELSGSKCIQTNTITIEPLFVDLTLNPDCGRPGVIELSANPTITKDIVYIWIDSEGNTIPGSNRPDISVEKSGTYTVVVTDLDGFCSVSNTIEVIIIPIETNEILLNDREIICSLDGNPDINSILLEPGLFDTYIWTIRGTPGVLSTQPTFLIKAGGSYFVQLSNGSTCINKRIIVEDDCSPKVQAPNAFTPDADGINDVFSVLPNEYVTNFTIYIYSRWGELIYQSDDIDFQWDGEYREGPLPGGTYAYVMRYGSTFDGGAVQKEQYGGVLILR